MKRVLTTLFLLVIVFSNLAKAQIQRQSYFEGGVILIPQYTALLNTNDFVAGNDLNYVATFGYAGGLTGSYDFNKHFGVELNLIYSAQGQKYKGNLYYYRIKGADTASFASLVAVQVRDSYNPSIGGFPDTNFIENILLTYIKIPVLFKWTSYSDKPLFFYLSAGPELNILLSASQSLNRTTVSYSTYNFTTKRLYKSLGVDAVLNIGGGYKLTDNLTLTAQVNFDYGLTDAEDKSFTFSQTSSGTTTEQHAYASNRSANNNATVGLRIGLACILTDLNKVDSRFTP